MTVPGPPPNDEPDARYVAGHDVGYTKGRDDGIGIGYSDAKLRMYRALDAVADTATPSTKAAVREVENALAALVGKR